MMLDDDWNLRRMTAEAAVAPAGREAYLDIWLRLVHHKLEVALDFDTEQRGYLTFRKRRNDQPPMCERNRDILERFLAGVGRKVISYESGLSQPTVAQILKGALADIGLHCSPARAPSLLVLLAHAARGTRSHAELLIGSFEYENERYLVLSEGFDQPFLTRLAPAERAVLRQLMRGSSYGDIAARRHTSYRTVANQIAAACHRLGVSGRLDLLQLKATFVESETAVHPA
jgi:DNA-binding NarL/FixJ family response regulator